MNWTDNLRRVTLKDGRKLIGGSFRGVPFLVEADDRAGGRRTVTHEFPQRNDPWVEDLGRKARTFQFEAYVIGDDYVAQRDALIEALEDKAGPGELVHPQYGIKRGICPSFNARHSTAEGRMVRITIEFAETPVQAVTPTEAVDLAGRVSLSADSALLAVAFEFESAYDAEGMPSFSLASAIDVLNGMSGGVLSALGPVVQSTQEMAKLKQQVDILAAKASSLVRQPGEILGAFRDTLAVLVETVAGAPAAVLQAFSAAYMIDTGPAAPLTTATRQRERANQLALDAALKRILAIEAARLAPRGDFESTEYALHTREQILDMLDEQAASAGDTCYPALVQLRADIIRAIPGDAELARILTVERPVAVPSILLSYQLYGSVAQEADILARNRTSHPGFMAGTLEVLSDV